MCRSWRGTGYYVQEYISIVVSQLCKKSFIITAHKSTRFLLHQAHRAMLPSPYMLVVRCPTLRNSHYNSRISPKPSEARPGISLFVITSILRYLITWPMNFCDIWMVCFGPTVEVLNCHFNRRAGTDLGPPVVLLSSLTCGVYMYLSLLNNSLSVPSTN